MKNLIMVRNREMTNFNGILSIYYYLIVDYILILILNF